MAKGKYEYWLTPDGLLRLEAYARDGLTDQQISEKVGINPATLYDWKKKYPEISESLKRGKEVVDIEVENALFKRAIGYRYKEIKTEETADGEKVTTTIKEVIPDVTAQIFWLKNRCPKKWRDKQDVEHSGILDVRKVYDEMSEEELMELAKKYEKINSS